MVIPVVCQVAYLCDRDLDMEDWRNSDFNAMKYVKALKGEPVNGFAKMPFGSSGWKLDESTAHEAPDWFGFWASGYLDKADLARSVLVPIPNKSAVVGVEDFHTLKLVNSTNDHLGRTTVVAALRWKEKWPSAHSAGGTRDPLKLIDNLQIVEPLPIGIPVILVDDVFTTGGSIRACAACLKRVGYQVVLALCAGMSTPCQTIDPYAIQRTVVSDDL